MTNDNVLTLDCEATIYEKGNPFSKPNRLMCVGTLFNGVSEYHDIEHSGLPYNRSIERLSQLLKQAKLIVGFNLKYDLHWLKHYIPSFNPQFCFDSQLAEFLIRNQTNPYPSLDFTSQLYGMEPKLNTISTEYWDKGIDTDKVPLGILKDRVLHDVKITYGVYLKQKELLKQQGKEALFNLQCQDLLVLQQMEYNGMRYNTEQSLTKATEVEHELLETTKQLNLLVGNDTINWNSNHHVSAILYGGWISSVGRESYTKTLKDSTIKTKERNCEVHTTFPRLVEPLKNSKVTSIKQELYSVDEPTLRSLHPTGKARDIIVLLLRHSELEKLRGTYYTGIPNLITKMAWSRDTIHGQFNQCVARTGRLSSSKPNLQNFADSIKPLFLPRFDTLINVDAKGLEWVCAAYLSRDENAQREIKQQIDTHEDNRQRFKLPSRLISKKYLFRMIFGGSAYAYANDPEFTDVSRKESFWQGVIDETYRKYKGLSKWHTTLMQKVVDTGRLVMPTGRQYTFEKEMGKDFPRPKILNYPVQGLGADLLSIVRVSLARRMQKLNLKSLLICTVHDSIVLDVHRNEVVTICNLVTKVFEDLPMNFKRVFGVEFNLPLGCEIKIGPNWGDMQVITKEFLKDYANQNSGSRTSRSETRAEGPVQSLPAFI